MEELYDETLIELNTAKARQLIPIPIYISLMMLVGILGNTLVCYFYAVRETLTPHSLFIVVLAVYDLLSCLITMPSVIVDVEMYYTFDNDAACKMLRFLNFALSTSSVLTLVAIAIDRYRMICRFTASSIQMAQVKKACAGIVGIAILLSWPSLLLYGVQEVHFQAASNGTNVTGFDCMFQTKGKYGLYGIIFNGVQVFLFIGFTIALISIYSIIGKTMRSLKSRATSRIKTDTLKFTKIMLSVTCVFILSFVPYFCAMIWIEIVGIEIEDHLKEHELLVYRFANVSHLLNNVANPFIYGFFNTQFREYVLEKFKSCICMKRCGNQHSPDTKTAGHLESSQTSDLEARV